MSEKHQSQCSLLENEEQNYMQTSGQKRKKKKRANGKQINQQK